MIRRCVVALVVSFSIGCGPRVMLTDSVGAEWDGHLRVGERMSFGAQVIEPTFGGYDVHPASRVVSESPAIVGVEDGPYGAELVGRAQGEAQIRLSFTDAGDRTVSIVVE